MTSGRKSSIFGFVRIRLSLNHVDASPVHNLWAFRSVWHAAFEAKRVMSITIQTHSMPLYDDCKFDACFRAMISGIHGCLFTRYYRLLMHYTNHLAAIQHMSVDHFVNNCMINMPMHWLNYDWCQPYRLHAITHTHCITTPAQACCTLEVQLHTCMIMCMSPHYNTDIT